METKRSITNQYYENKIIVANRYNIYKSTIALYKCILIVEKPEDKSSLKEMIKRKESNETSI